MKLSNNEITQQLNINIISTMNHERESLQMWRQDASVRVQISSNSGQIVEVIFGAYYVSKLT